MKTWVEMYLIIWLAFLEIMLVMFLPVSYTINMIIHSILGVAILYFAYEIYHRVHLTSCPDRIKRITRVTWSLAVIQAILGIVLAIGIALSWGSLFSTVLAFLHVGNALAIITQASSSATAYDMWEEKEFVQTPKVEV